MEKLTRTACGAALALAFAIVAAAPATAAQPTRTLIYVPPSTGSFDAGAFSAARPRASSSGRPCRVISGRAA